MEISPNQGTRLASLLIRFALISVQKTFPLGGGDAGEREGEGRRKDGGGEGFLKMRMVGRRKSVLLECARVSPLRLVFHVPRRVERERLFSSSYGSISL